MSFRICYIILVTLILFIGIGSSIKCYQCITKTENEMCDASLQPVDCEANTTDRMFGKDILPAEGYGGKRGSQRYCHKVIMKSGTVVRTCLDVDGKNISKTCEDMKYATAAAATDATVDSCTVCGSDSCNGAESSGAKSGAYSFSFSLTLFTLTFIVFYLVYKQ